VIIEAQAATAADGRVDVTWTMNADVVAVTTTEFIQHLSFEESEQGRLLEASVTSTSHPDLNYTEKFSQLVPDKEPMVSSWSGTKIKMKKGDEIHSYIKFLTRGEQTGFTYINFGNSTVNQRIRVSSAPELEVFASSSDQRNGDEYIHRKVFVPGDHIQVRWRRKREAEKRSEEMSGRSTLRSSPKSFRGFRKHFKGWSIWSSLSTSQNCKRNRNNDLAKMPPALQAGGHRFDPGHVHQLNLRSLNHLRSFFLCTTLVQLRDNRDNRLLFEIGKSESAADSLRFVETYLHFFV